MKTEMKIAYLMTPVEFGGAERVSLNFLKNVDRNKFDVYPVLLIRPWEKENAFIQEIEKENYPLYKVPVALKTRSEGRDYLRVIRCYSMIYSMLKKGSFDVVHTHGYFADIVGILAAKILRIPNISTCHGFISNDRNLILYNTMDRIVLRFSNKIIAVSEGIKDYLIRSRIKDSRIVVIQNAVNGNYNTELLAQRRQKKRQLFGIKEKEFVIGYVGRLSEEKGIKYLIEACSMLDELEVPAKLLIIGEGPQKKEFEDLVKERGIKPKVFFAGFQSDIENWLPSIDVFVLPSKTEGTPMALLEAMSFELPVVASRVGGVPNIIVNGVNGILIDAGNSKGLAKALKRLFDEPSIGRIMAKNALKTIKNQYDVHSWCRKIEREYNRVTSETFCKKKCGNE